MKNFTAKARRRRKKDDDDVEMKIGPNTAKEIDSALARVRFGDGKPSSEVLYEDMDFYGARALNDCFENDDDIPWIRCKDLAMQVLFLNRCSLHCGYLILLCASP